MILAVDVQYQENSAFVAGVSFDRWEANSIHGEYLSVVHHVAEYEPGSFYKRELPCILKLLKEHQLQPQTIVVDGYVFLDGVQQPGLGKHLYDALGGSVDIVGVAKKAFHSISEGYALLRGASKKPLYITTTGDLEVAKQHIKCMCGEHRIPTFIKRADQLCREEAQKNT